MIKHLVQCGPCKKEVEAVHRGGDFAAPTNWLTVDYKVIDNHGAYAIFEERHACPDCAPKVVDVLARVI